MAWRLEAGWDMANFGDIEIDVTEQTGTVNFQGSIPAAGKYCHTDISSIVTGYSDIASDLEAELTTWSSLGGNSWNYTVAWDGATGKYTISADGGNIALSLSSPASNEARWAQLFGFTEVDHAYAASHTSNLSPYYYINGAMGAASDVSDDYEPRGVVDGSEADDGTHYAISRTTAPTYSDFRITFETKAATFKRSASALVPWTFQHAWEHLRGHVPFLVVDDAESTIHYLRPDGASWAPDRAAADWDGGWHIPFNTYMEGRL